MRKPGPSSSSRRNLTDLTTIISRRRHWESRRAVIPRRVRGQSLSVARLLSRSVRFYFALSQPPPLSISPLPRHLRLTLLFPLDPSFLVAFPTTSSRVLWSLGAFPLFLSPFHSDFLIPLLLYRHLYRGRSLLSLSRVTPRPYFPPSRPSTLLPSRSDAPAPPAHPSYSPLPSRARSSTIPNSPFSLASFFLSLPTSFALFLSLSHSRPPDRVASHPLSRAVLTFAAPLLACQRR